MKLVRKEIGNYFDYKTIDKLDKNTLDWTWNIGESKILMNSVIMAVPIATYPQRAININIVNEVNDMNIKRREDSDEFIQRASTHK